MRMSRKWFLGMAGGGAMGALLGHVASAAGPPRAQPAVPVVKPSPAKPAPVEGTRPPKPVPASAAALKGKLAARRAGSVPTGADGIPSFDHIFLLVMENHAADEIIGNPDAPFINALAAQYGLAASYFAVAHPSEPNYLALTGGDTFGIADDGPHVVDAPNLAVDRIQAAGLTWRAYLEGMASPCETADDGTYGQDHNPWVHYAGLVNTPACPSNVVPYAQLASDLASAGTTPNFVWITPGTDHSMDTGSVPEGDAWLSTAIPAILGAPAFTQQDSVLFVVWDEDDGSQGNQVPCLVISPLVPAGFQSSTRYNHYSLLRTIEQAWRLGHLTDNDWNAPPMSDFFAGPSSPPPCS